ncbi:MAG TPA: class I SAM-dependent methyltransferase [Tepidisphaeraceae bacterium]|jgi:hypothetical protein|nr:class I SAM-dependent methyltransferase [Tepidisphaeraceae bacterium]
MNLPSLFRRLFSSDRSAPDRFTLAYHANGFRGTESVSGPGSDLEQTAILRTVIPRLLKSLYVRTMLDCPCGDFHWMKLVDLPVEKYIGGDVVAELAAENQKQFGSAQREFRQINLLNDPLPEADILLCRDCLVHLTTREIGQAIQNIRRSPITFLLTTTFPATTANRELESTHGAKPKWRPLNLQLPPFNFPAPLEIINEHCTEKNGRYPDKSLGLWKVADLPSPAT